MPTSSPAAAAAAAAISTRTEQEDAYVSYKSLTTVVADTVYHFCRGCLYGAAYGLVTPFYAPGTAGAALEATTGRFTPAPFFSQWRSVPSHALLFGSLLGVQRLTCKSTEFLRGKQDVWNDMAGIGVAYPYYQTFLATHRIIFHNRVVGGAIALAVIMTNVW